MDKKTLDKVAESSLFRGISDVGKMMTCFCARRIKFAAGEEIVGYGDEPSVAIITSGSATVVSEDWFGNRTVINRLSESGIFGAAFAFSGHEVTTRLVGAENGEAVLINGRRLHAPCATPCESHTRFLYNAVTVISRSCVGFLENVEHLSRRTMRDKVLSYLSAEAVKRGAREFDIPFSRQELADYLAVDRSALSAELGRMKADGLIDYRRAHFVITDGK